MVTLIGEFECLKFRRKVESETENQWRSSVQQKP